MPQVKRSWATLRVIGDDLDPTEITALLGCEPTSKQIKGETIIGKSTDLARTASFGRWSLKAAAREPEDLDGQITELLSNTTSDLKIWKSIADRYRLELFCGIFLSGSNEGLSISPSALASLGLRHIELGLDIYEGDRPGSEA